MNPFLTTAGKGVVLSGFAFLALGVILSNPVLLLLGQAQLVLLVCATLMTAPTALLLDRRKLAVEVHQKGDGSDKGGHVVGDVIDLEVTVRNPTKVGIHNLALEPFAADGIDARLDEGRLTVPSRQLASGDMRVSGRRTGRWTLQGFDVRATDPFGLVEVRDYVAAVHPFEFYPRAGPLRSRRPLRFKSPPRRVPGGQHLVTQRGYGTDLRQLRDHQPGDTLRDIAWKATVRNRRLLSREFEREIERSVYVMLDISSSMRGGQAPGQKLEFAIELVLDLIDSTVADRDRVGLVTFDEKTYGHLPPGNSVPHVKRMIHHLVGLNAIVDADLTELDEAELYKLVADYLLVQERLDFRKGADVDDPGGVNASLLKRWLEGVLPRFARELDSPALREGVLTPERHPVRRFLQLRGVEVPYRVEARLGMKERGLVESFEHIIRSGRERHLIVVVTDLCGVMNPDLAMRGVRLARSEGHEVIFFVPFTPEFYDEKRSNDARWTVVRELFTAAEFEERTRIADRLREAGVDLRFIGPPASDETREPIQELKIR